MTFNFFYKDFVSNYFYWECLIFFRKFLMNLFSALSEELSLEISEIFNILIISVFILINLKNNPYQSAKMNRFEILSLIVCLITVISNYTFMYVDKDQIKQFLVFLCFGVNVGFLSFCGFFLSLEAFNLFMKKKPLTKVPKSNFFISIILIKINVSDQISFWKTF